MVCGLKQGLKRVTNGLICLKKKENNCLWLFFLKFAYFIYICSLGKMNFLLLGTIIKIRLKVKKITVRVSFLRSFLSCCCNLLHQLRCYKALQIRHWKICENNHDSTTQENQRWIQPWSMKQIYRKYSFQTYFFARNQFL